MCGEGRPPSKNARDARWVAVGTALFLMGVMSAVVFFFFFFFFSFFFFFFFCVFFFFFFLFFFLFFFFLFFFLFFFFLFHFFFFFFFFFFLFFFGDRSKRKREIPTGKCREPTRSRDAHARASLEADIAMWAPWPTQTGQSVATVSHHPGQAQACGHGCAPVEQASGVYVMAKPTSWR